MFFPQTSSPVRAPFWKKSAHCRFALVGRGPGFCRDKEVLCTDGTRLSSVGFGPTVPWAWRRPRRMHCLLLQVRQKKECRASFFTLFPDLFRVAGIRGKILVKGLGLCCNQIPVNLSQSSSSHRTFEPTKDKQVSMEGSTDRH